MTFMFQYINKKKQTFESPFVWLTMYTHAMMIIMTQRWNMQSLSICSTYIGPTGAKLTGNNDRKGSGLNLIRTNETRQQPLTLKPFKEMSVWIFYTVDYVSMLDYCPTVFVRINRQHIFHISPHISSSFLFHDCIELIIRNNPYRVKSMNEKLTRKRSPRMGMISSSSWSFSASSAWLAACPIFPFFELLGGNSLLFLYFFRPLL